MKFKWQNVGTLVFFAFIISILGFVIIKPFLSIVPSGTLTEFCHNVHYMSVLASAWVTLSLYQIAHQEGWNDSTCPLFKWYMYFPALSVTLVTVIGCLLTIGDLYHHLLAQTCFFASFVIWDIFHIIDKKGSQGVAAECRDKTFYWLFNVDLPTPLLFWIAYWISKDRSVPIGGVDAQELVMSGVISAVLFRQVWEWLVDCLGEGIRRLLSGVYTWIFGKKD